MTTQKRLSWSPAELHRNLVEGSRFTILDVRNRDEFDAWRIEGKVPIGTHNIPYFDLLELQTADEEILPGGTGYITDIGMTGPFNSVIGMKKEQAIFKFLYQAKTHFEVASENVRLNGIIMVANRKGKAEDIIRINVA